MTQFIVNSNWLALDRMFTRLFWQSVAVSLMGGITVVAILWLFFAHPLANRLLPISDMIFLLIAFFLAHMIGALALNLRMHKREPFMLVSVIGVILVALSLWFFGRLFGVTGMTLSLIVINLVYGLLSELWLRLRKAWHQPIGTIYE